MRQYETVLMPYFSTNDCLYEYESGHWSAFVVPDVDRN